MSDPTTVVSALVGIILLGGGAAGFKALTERRSIGANATAVVTAAARELVDPLRKELATERAEHEVELQEQKDKHKADRQEEQAQIAELRAELAAAYEEASRLRTALHDAWDECEKARRRVMALEKKISGT